MKAVGLVTFWDYNFGSSLQCYATKKVIDSFGLRCDLLEECPNSKANYYFRKIKKAFFITIKTIRYPNFFKAYVSMRKSAKIATNSISSKTKEEIHFLGKTVLQPKRLTRKSLIKLGNSDEYIGFITGSDQVWGGHFVEPTYGNFLEFAPREKRISYAASFGSGDIANYNISHYKKGIMGFDVLSVREDKGINIVKKLTGLNAVKMPDPTVLLSTDEWIQFAEDTDAGSEPYILIHFLDKLSKIAVNTINQIQKETTFRIICIGWKHDEIDALDRVFFKDGGPKDYMSLISKASYVCTDSFHTTLFSLRFGRQFYTFDRQYIAHNISQSSRLQSLLNDCNCSERLIGKECCDFSLLPREEIKCDDYFASEREKGISFLKLALNINNEVNRTISHPVLKEDNECCGCGVCAERCPKHAIEMVNSNFFGYKIPKVNVDSCIHCGLCEIYCSKVIDYRSLSKKSYIAYSSNNDLLRKASSGGVFATIASDFIKKGGIVYGVTLDFVDGEPKVYHRSAKTLNELDLLLQSKYIQSNAVCVFEEIKEKLSESSPMLFSGTSCQVDALFRYLGEKKENLYTIDLICHGVPGSKLFFDYVAFLSKKESSHVKSFSFREKQNGKIKYIEKVLFENGTQKVLNPNKSDYYSMFFNRDSYREGCYSCQFSSITKPADITIGDYFECKLDYPKLFESGGLLTNTNGISCMIVHNERGKRLLESFGNGLNIIEADLRKIQNSHEQLCFPSVYTDMREKMISLYTNGGFTIIHKFNVKKRIITFIPHVIKLAIKKTLQI